MCVSLLSNVIGWYILVLGLPHQLHLPHRVHFGLFLIDLFHGSVGIMVNGTFRCLGTPQQLKSSYGDGYRLKLRVSGPLEPIQEFIRQNFPSSVLKVSQLLALILLQVLSNHMYEILTM